MALKQLENFYKTTISTAWTTGTGNRYIATLPTASTGRLVINPANSTKREIIEYSAKGTDGGGNYITVSARGVGGTTDQAHDIGEAVRSNITAEVITDIQTELDLKMDDTQIDTDGTLAANSDTKLASQKATKTYVDAVSSTVSSLDSANVKLTGDQTIAGVKTFSSSPIVPTPTTAYQPATKEYVDGGILQGAANSSTTVKGIGKVSVAPVSATDPIFVGDNDPRVGADYTPKGLIAPLSSRVVPSGWLLCDGSAVSRTTYAALFAAMTPTGVFTVTIASPAVFSKTAHTLVEGDIVHFTTTGALPTGLAVNTDYYVIATGLTVDAFRVSTTRGGAAVNTSGTQSGVHTFFATNDGKGDGSTTFNLPNLKGKTIFGYDVTDANFSSINVPKTYVGEKTHILDITEIPAHTHSTLNAGGVGGGAQDGTPDSVGTPTTTGSAGGGLAHNNMPPYSVRNYIIKY